MNKSDVQLALNIDLGSLNLKESTIPVHSIDSVTKNQEHAEPNVYLVICQTTVFTNSSVSE